MREEPIAGDPHTRRSRRHRHSLSRVLGVRRHHRAGRLRRQRQPRGLRLAGVSRHRRARQDRPRPLLGALQLPRLQGPDGRAAWRRRHPDLLRSDRRRPGERRGVSRRPVGTGESHSARRHRLRLHGARRSADAGLGVDARRAASRASDAVSLPAIVSAPLSYNDARVILEALGGPEVPLAWRGAAAFPYRAGPGQAVVRLRVRFDDRIRPVWTVTG